MLHCIANDTLVTARRQFSRSHERLKAHARHTLATLSVVLDAPPMLSWAAAALYLLTATACAGAGWAVSRRRFPVDRTAWWLIGALFTFFAAIRLTGADALAGATLRAFMMRSGEYDLRRSFQAPLAAALVLFGFAVTVGVLYYWRSWSARFGRHLTRALVASAAMLLLVAFRSLSFHAIDALLYAGPIHPNWAIDLGLTAIVAWCAMAAAWDRPRPTRHT